MSAEVELEEERYSEFSNIQNNLEKQIKILFAKNNYRDAIENLAIIPTLFSDNLLQYSEYKEIKRYFPKKKSAEFPLRINHKEYISADHEGRKKLILQNILDSIALLDQKVKEKKGGIFDGERLIKDIEGL